jgi:hypothetical protein
VALHALELVLAEKALREDAPELLDPVVGFLNRQCLCPWLFRPSMLAICPDQIFPTQPDLVLAVSALDSDAI